MECPNCRHENPPESNFCLKCGGKLERNCPHCAKPLPPDAIFCNHCGQDLSQPAPPSVGPTKPVDAPTPTGERRQATILFSDLSGYTAMNEKLDPEEVETIMSRIKGEAVKIVEAHGGIVNQFVGDEVVALFGIPTAHGDDPQRAVTAALEMHELVRGLSLEVEENTGQPLTMHTGINTGLIVTSLRDNRDGRYGITGDTVNTGARLAAQADHDEIVVSPATQRLIASYFSTEALKPVVLKGKTGPIVPYRVLGERETWDMPRQAFVGRQGELKQFAGIWEICRKEGTGHAIYLRGEAGIGKTRLVEEFQAIAKAQGCACHTGLVLAFGVGKGQDAMRSLVQRLLGIIPGSDEATRRSAAQKGMAEGLADPEQEVFLNDLLTLPQPAGLRGTFDAMDNQTRTRGKQETLVEIVKRAGARLPVLLVVEDLHWADLSTLNHMAALTSAVATLPAVLVMTSRFEGDPLDQAWRVQARSPPMTMDLAPLGKEDALALAGEFMDATSRFATKCVERAAGNPLFLEQLLRNAEETGEDAIPGAIQSIVLARMDKLKPLDKQALQAASIIGQRFPLDLLRHLMENPGFECGGLIEHHLVRPEGEDFLFAHALIQEGIYTSLLKSKRRALHRRAADWFADGDTALRAEHLDQADDEGASGAYLEAARKLALAYQFDRALQFVARGLELARDQSDTVALILFQGKLLHDLGSIGESMAAYRNALELAQEDVQRCRAWIGLAAGMRITDRYDDALEALEKAESTATDHGLAHELAQLHHLRGNLYFPLGNLDGCLREHEQALDYAKLAGSIEFETRAISGMGDAYFLRGRMKTAHGHFRRSVELSREHGLGRIEVANLPMLGWTGLYLGELDDALQHASSAVEMANRVSHQRAEGLARGLLGFILSEFKGDWTEAKRQTEQSLALARSLNSKRFEARNMTVLAKIALGEGNRARALEYVNEALRISREAGMNFIGPWILAALARVTDDPAIGGKALAEGEAILRAGCVGHNYLWFYRDAMHIAHDLGDWGEMERYAAALEEYTHPEPLPWSDFFVARGRALAAFGKGRRDDGLLGELKALRVQGERVGFNTDLPALDRVLAEFGRV